MQSSEFREQLEQTMFILKHCVITIHTSTLYKNNKDT